MQRFDARHMKTDFPCVAQLVHLVDAVLRGAKAVAVVDEGDLPRNGCEIDRPIQRRIAAAGDQNVLVAESVHPAHGVVHAHAFICFDASDRRPLRHKASGARSDHNDGRNDFRARIGCDFPAAIRKLREPVRHLSEMELRMEGFDLLHQFVGQFLASDDRKAGNVVNGFLGIKLRTLTARAVEDVHELAFEVEKAQLEHSEQRHRPRAHYRHIGLDRHISHFSGVLMEKQRCLICRKVYANNQSEDVPGQILGRAIAKPCTKSNAERQFVSGNV